MAINQPPPQLPPYPGFQPTPTPPPIPPERPSEINVIAGLTLASGIINVLGAILYSVLVALGSLGIGCLCLPVFLPLLILGIIEIAYASRLFGLPHSGARISIPIAVFEIVAIIYLNFVSLASGIVALILQGNSRVGSYFAYLDALEYQPDPYSRR